jgi:hypothetical protein
MLKNSLDLDTVVLACKDQVSADLADEVVILSLKNGEYYGLNAVGATIWALIQQSCTVASVRAHLLETYPDVEPERCTRELLALLEQLAEAGLVEVAASSGQ